LAIVLGGLLAVPFSGGSVSFAKGKFGSKFETKLQTKLLPSFGISIEDFKGKVKYKKKTSKKGSEEAIEAHVESDIPNTTLGITDESSAASSSFLLKIFQGSTTTEKGSCILLIKEIEFDYEDDGLTVEGLEAAFAAKVTDKIPLTGISTLTKKVGTCQVTTLINNIPTLVDGIPDVVAGDTAGIYSSTPNSPALLSGIFQSGNRHDDNDDDDDEDEDEDDDD